MSERCQRFKAILVRRKRLDPASVLATELRRCLSTLDLAVLGIGMMIGPGIFVLTGTLVRHMTGPAVFVSYTITGLVSLLAAFCYAELGARVPRAGSAYLYTYIAIGEPWAFFVGWNMLLEYIVADAATAKTFSASVNALANDVIAKWSLSHLWLGLSFPEGNYPDFVAVLLVIAAVICIGCGVRESVNINNLLTLIIVLVLGLLIGVGFYYADIDNWTEVPGGFMPDGFGGVMLGAAACFYAYVGFESIAVAGEETENPSRSIPIALCVAMTFVTLIYALSSAVLTLMVPYYSVHTAAPFTIAFAQVGAIWAKYVVGIGAIIAISTSVLGQLFVACRILYAMANDGLLFGILAKVNPRTQMPIYAALLCGVLISVLALMVALEILVELVSIGTVMCQAMVSTSVLVLRYRPQAECTFDRRLDPVKSSEDGDNLPLGPDANDNTGKLKKSCQNIWFFKTFLPTRLTTPLIVSIIFPMALCASLITHAMPCLMAGTWWAVLLLCISVIWTVSCFAMLLVYEQNTNFTTFKVPLVPLTPSITLFINIIMLLQLRWMPWARVAVWLFVGFLIYYFYGMKHSKENRALVERENESVAGTGQPEQ